MVTATLCENFYCFAAIPGDGCIGMFGDAHRGGNRSAVRDQLRNAGQLQATKDLVLQQIQASAHAIRAILGDGFVLL